MRKLVSRGRAAPRKQEARRLQLLLICALCAAVPAPLRGQASPVSAGEVTVNSEIERYLRVLQVAGAVDPYPWSLRSFLDREVDRLSPTDSRHPWGESMRMRWGGTSAAEVVAPRVRLVHNSAFPHGANDGPVWAGRGMTVAAEAGVRLRYGPLSATIQPIWFRTQNGSFPLAPTGIAGRELANPRRPTTIDAPQRFGRSSYGRLDPGQSSVQLDLRYIAGGVSTANQHWGPAREYPIILGSNAPGFLHAFIGTSRPLDLFVGRLHGRVIWGELEQSDLSPVQGARSRRLGTGLVVLFQPRGVPGLELGATRIHHSVWPADGIGTDEIFQPFENPFTGNQGSLAPRNQLASAFFRWLFPRSGVEVYGEFGREDYNEDFRDLLLEPDHDSAYTLGLLKSWELAPRRLLATGIEVMDAQITHLERVRRQTPLYPHGSTRQGHTQLGQFLGSPAVFGGAGTAITVDYFHPGGRISGRWARELRDRDVAGDIGEEPRDLIDSLQEYRVEGVLFRGQWEIDAGIGLVQNFDRNFGDDVLNLNTAVGVRWRW